MLPDTRTKADYERVCIFCHVSSKFWLVCGSWSMLMSIKLMLHILTSSTLKDGICFLELEAGDPPYWLGCG